VASGAGALPGEAPRVLREAAARKAGGGGPGRPGAAVVALECRTDEDGTSRLRPTGRAPAAGSGSHRAGRLAADRGAGQPPAVSHPTADAETQDGELLELAIDALAAGGDGVGRDADGRVVFVPFAAPGDRARVRITERHRRFARGQLEELLAPGPARREPACPVFGTCGGCTWQHVDYAAQVEAKRAILRDALERLGKLRLPSPPELVPAPAPYAYRGRARVLVNRGRVGFRRRRSHRLCATNRCPILVPGLERALAELAARAPRDHPEDVGEWELVAGADGTARVTPLARPLPRSPRLALAVEDDRLEVSPGVFVQAHPALHGALARAVHEAAGRGDTAVELFCGAGFFTLGLARRFARVVAVESEGRAVADLHRNLEAAGLGNVEPRRGRAERILAGIPGPVDALVVDPPRTGLPPGCVEAVADRAPGRLVYVSCAPDTLARDLARLVDRGYALTRVQGLDLFPQTPHLEAVATLERTPGAVFHARRAS